MFEEKPTEELIKELNYAEGRRNELKDIFVSKDLVLSSDCVVSRGGPVDVETLLGKGRLPPVNEFQAGIQHMLEVSTRSALAQAGIEVWVNWDRLPADAWERIERGENVPLSISLLNWGAADIQLKKGEGIFRFFYYAGRLEGKRLAETLSSKEVCFSGQYGVDWWAETGEGQRLREDEMERASLIRLAFDPNHRLFVPPSSQPVHLPPRSRMNEALQPIPEDAAIPFYVTETLSKISMGKNVYGVILTGVEDETNQHHLQSPLIDAGYGAEEGGSRVRLEIFDQAGLSAQKPYVHLNIIPRTVEE